MKNRFLWKSIRFTYFFGAFFTLFTIPAFAYIDPATTSYLIQIVAGVVIAAGATVGVFWKKIQLFLKKKRMEHLENSLKQKAEKEDQK